MATYYIETLGCPKNEVDSEGMEQVLREAGLRPGDSARAADVLIVNTCGFVEAARDESVQALRLLAKGKGRKQVLVAAGCLAQLDASLLKRRVPRLDAVVGVRDWASIGEVVASALRGRAPDAVRESAAARPTPRPFPGGRQATSASAYIKIADGCNATCAFCVIPTIKGAYWSKPLAAIVREAQELAAQGVKEITLVAQDVTAYGCDLGMADGLPRVVESILDAAPEVPWVRLMYAYPERVSDRLIKQMATLPHLCHYLDVPLQHAHPEMLRRMGRPADVDRTRALIARLRDAAPDIALRTTFIVGFPGETEAEFDALLAFLSEMQFDHVGVFPYSRETGTRAAGLPEQVSERVKEHRFRLAMERQQAVSLQRNRLQVGRVLPVLIEGAGDDGLLVGRSYRDAPEVDGFVLLNGRASAGDMVNVHISGALEYDLLGELQG